MNIKDLVLPVGLALVSVFALNYFFPSDSIKKDTESSFLAPRERKEYKPLNVEIDFFDQNLCPVEPHTRAQMQVNTIV